jgi:hypothetical protein
MATCIVPDFGRLERDGDADVPVVFLTISIVAEPPARPWPSVAVAFVRRGSCEPLNIAGNVPTEFADGASSRHGRKSLRTSHDSAVVARFASIAE